VRYILLAPVPRGPALRAAALRQLRFLAFAGLVVGGIAGVLASRRLPEHAVAWVLAGAAVGGLGAPAAAAAALATSGRRVPSRVAALVALAVVGWSAADVAAGVATSPFTLLGRLALWPLHVDLAALVGVAAALALPMLGLIVIGGLSLEAAERRASLVAQLRFAVTLQDLRTVILLRRQLAQERPRPHPWLRLPGGGADPVWRRDWRGLLRWPAVREARAALLAAGAGLALRGAWSGTTPLIVVAGLAAFVAALDVVEPLAQEVDHPDLGASLPMPEGRLHVRHLPALVAAMVPLGLIGVGAAVAVGPDRGLTAGVGLAMVLPASAAAALGAAASALKSGAGGRASSMGLFPELTGPVLVFGTAWPPAVAVVGTLPVLAARAAFRAGQPAAPAAVSAGVGVLVLCAYVVAWARFRVEAREWWDEMLEGIPGVGGGSKE